ncbi:putative glutathione S-transferase [Rhizodiscina lignyota]|uniref:Glutathione S-transferase n=1 Tax=Rhizodiscina lignyota TaxID=1504668 RepID=A0A9P4IID4_9PEZI|nr:putative glutathione S-transferase [Rhizodiscina lignyota]
METSSEQTTIPTLHHLSSSQSNRVLWALEELAEGNGLKYGLKAYPREHGVAPKELKSISPLGKSPILTVEPVDQSGHNSLAAEKEVVTESRIILQFISDNYSNGIWVPESPEDKKRDAFFQEFANSTLQPKVTYPLIFELIPVQLPFGLRQLVQLMVKPVVNHWLQDLGPIYQVLEDALSEEKPWFAGAKLGLADFCMNWGMDIATHRKYFDAAKYPKLGKWYMTVVERPAYKATLQKGGSYDLLTFDS